MTVRLKASSFVLTEDNWPLLAKLSREHVEVLRATGSCDDIAASLGLKVGTVKSRMHRARKALLALQEASEAANG